MTHIYKKYASRATSSPARLFDIRRRRNKGWGRGCFQKDFEFFYEKIFINKSIKNETKE